MKKELLTILIAFSVNAISAQTTNWAWASNNPSASNDDNGTAVASDAQGNTYYTGAVRSTMPGGFTTSANVFLIKKDMAGSTVWSKLLGGDSDDAGTSVAVDQSGNIYLIGTFKSSAFACATTTLASAGATDAFLAKFNAAGTEQWVQRFGNTQYDEPYDVATDITGNIFIAGDYSSSTLAIGTTTLTNNSAGSETDLFITKFDASGASVWAKSYGSSTRDKARSITTDLSGNVYVTGDFYGTFSMGTFTLTQYFAPINIGDAYIAKFDPTGTPLWAKTGGSNDADMSKSVAVDKFGNSYIAGAFGGTTISFGTFTLTNTNSSGVIDNDIFITKYNPSGTELWSKSLGGTVTDIANGIAIDTSSNVYITGSYTSASLTIGATTFTNVVANKKDIFIAKYDAGGNAVWGESVGNIGDDETTGICSDNNNNVCLVGTFKGTGFSSSTLSFGANTLTNTFAMNGDVFAAKFGVSIPTAIINQAASKETLSVYPNPNSGAFTIALSESAQITITNSLGQTVYNESQEAGNHFISLPNEANGVYFVKTTISGEVAMQKIIVNY